MQRVGQPNQNKGAQMHSLENYFRTKLNVTAMVYIGLIFVAVYAKLS